MGICTEACRTHVAAEHEESPLSGSWRMGNGWWVETRGSTILAAGRLVLEGRRKLGGMEPDHWGYQTQTDLLRLQRDCPMWRKKSCRVQMRIGWSSFYFGSKVFRRQGWITRPLEVSANHRALW